MPKRWPYLTQPPIEHPNCQLLAGLNAIRFHGAYSPEPGDPVYDVLMDIANCWYEGATNAKEAWQCAGLAVETGVLTLDWLTNRLDAHIPVAITGEFEVPHMGLVIDVHKDCLQIVNWVANEPISIRRWDDLLREPGIRDYGFALSYPGTPEVW